MANFKKTLTLSLVLASFVGISQTSIKQDISSENGKIKIHVEKEENGKKEIFDKTIDAKGMTENERQALIDHVTDSLTSGSGKNMKMRVKVDRDYDKNIVIIDGDKKNNGKKKIIIKKDGKTINKSGDEGAVLEDLDLDFDLDFDDGGENHFQWKGKDFDMGDFQNKMGDLGKTLQFKMDEFGPQMKKWGEDMEPHFRKFANGDYFSFDTGSSSKTIKNLSAYPNKPNNNKLNVKFNSPEKGNVTITVTDITGKELGREKIADFEGEYFGQVDLKGPVKGTVFVTVVQGTDGNVKRVVVE